LNVLQAHCIVCVLLPFNLLSVWVADYSYPFLLLSFFLNGHFLFRHLVFLVLFPPYFFFPQIFSSSSLVRIVFPPSCESLACSFVFSEVTVSSVRLVSSQILRYPPSVLWSASPRDYSGTYLVPPSCFIIPQAPFVCCSRPLFCCCTVTFSVCFHLRPIFTTCCLPFLVYVLLRVIYFAILYLYPLSPYRFAGL